MKRLLLILLLVTLAWHWWPVHAPAVENPPPLVDLPAAELTRRTGSAGSALPGRSSC